MNMELAADSFLKLLRERQSLCGHAKPHKGRRGDNGRDTIAHVARQDAENDTRGQQLYDPFDQAGGQQSPSVSFDGFAPLQIGPSSAALPSWPKLRLPWR